MLKVLWVIILIVTPTSPDIEFIRQKCSSTEIGAELKIEKQKIADILGVVYTTLVMKCVVDRERG